KHPPRDFLVFSAAPSLCHATAGRSYLARGARVCDAHLSAVPVSPAARRDSLRGCKRARGPGLPDASWQGVGHARQGHTGLVGFPVRWLGAAADRLGGPPDDGPFREARAVARLSLGHHELRPRTLPPPRRRDSGRPPRRALRRVEWIRRRLHRFVPDVSTLR